MIGCQQSRSWAVAQRAGALLCVLLVFLVSLVAVAHVHSSTLGAADHSCSLCALAHSGVALSEVGTPPLVFATTPLPLLAAHSARALLVVSSSYIRPPPAV